MTCLGFLQFRPADIESLTRAADVPALIALMGHTDSATRRHAVGALASLGTPVVPRVIAALHSPRSLVRLGATEVLAAVRDPRAIGSLTGLITREKYIEIRWAAIFALGEIGSLNAVPDLVHLLKDENKFLRYGAARSLEKLGWQASVRADEIAYLIALQEWSTVKKYGAAAVPRLSETFRETDASTRSSILSVISDIGGPEAYGTCRAGLKDRDSTVRWTAVLTAMNCGIRSIHLPPFVARRERTGPDPAAAALLNFLFLGIGYNYIGKWWGFPVFMTYMSVLVLAQLSFGPFLPYLVAYPVTAILGIHTYYLTRRMSDL